jgi:hypothetical protein
MTSLHVGMNSIPEKEMKEIITTTMRKDSMKILCEVPIKDKTLTELDISGKNLGIEGAFVVAEYLRDNEVLTRLDISKNTLFDDDSTIVGKVISDMLAANSTLKELDVSSSAECGRSSKGGPSFAQALSVGISGNGAISKFTFSGDSPNSKPVTMETSMVEADFSGKGLDSSGAIMAAAFLPKCT